MMKLPDNIHGRLRLTYMGLATIPLLVVGLVITWTTYTLQRSQLLDLQQELAQRVGTEVQAYIQSLENELFISARVARIDSLPQAQQELILEQWLAKQDAFAELAVLDVEGRELARKSYKDIILREDYRSRSNAPEFLAFKNNPKLIVFYGPVDFTDKTHEPIMTIAIPLRGLPTQALKGVLVAVVRLKHISELIAGIDVAEGNTIYMVQEGEVIAHKNPSIVQNPSILPGIKSFDPIEAKNRGVGLDGAPALLGIDQRRLGEQTFAIVAEAPASRVFNLALSSWLVILGFVLLAIGAAAALALAATNHITRPIHSLVVVAENIREGDLSEQATPSGLKELDTLANTFNSMTGQLRQTLESLEQRVADRTQALKTSAEVSRYLSTILDTNQLVTEVASLVQTSFNYYHVNIYLFDATAQNLVLVAGTGQAGQNMLAEKHQVSHSRGLVGQSAARNQPVLAANTLEHPEWITNPWLPDTRAELVVPISRGAHVLGVLDIQHHIANGLQQKDTDLMQSIANQLAIALLNAQSFEKLVAEKLIEAQQKEDAERRWEAYRRSPGGQAEQFAQDILSQPENSFAMLHQLAQTAGQNLDTAALLNHLPRLLEDTQPQPWKRDLTEIHFLAKIAEGFNFLIASQNAPELLLVGLRTLTRQLNQPLPVDWDGTAQAHLVYQTCQEALEARTVPEITQGDWKQITKKNSTHKYPLTPLVETLSKIQVVIEALTAYERVTTMQDKLAYLVSAVERLRHLERKARVQLGGADLNIVLRITENWQAIIARSLSELQSQAKIICRLLTRHSRPYDIIALTLQVWNDGRGAALNLKISLLPGPEYTLLDETAELPQLDPGEEATVVLRLRPSMELSVPLIRVRFMMLYDDPRGPNQSEHFADVIHLLSEQHPFQYIPNPYVVGTPLEPGSALFFGREDLLAAIQENLQAAHRNNLVLIGQRRMGKTSLLKQLRVRLGTSFVPVYLDGQVMGLDPGLAHFFLNLATEIMFALEDQGIALEPPTLNDFETSPAATFEYQFLTKVFSVIGDRTLLILFDEFEELENAVKRGYLEDSIFGYLRHLIQHTAKLSFIFCGTHHLEELVADYWNVLFNISLYQRVGYLTHEEAMRLIQHPVEPYGVQYDDLALEKIWRVTAGHPYFLQLICHSLVNRHNKTQNNYLTVAEVNAALDEILSTGEAHFIYLWMDSTAEERMTLVAMSRMIPLTGPVQAIQINDYLAERGVPLDRRAVREALHRLTLRNLLKVDEFESVEEPVYRWQLGLLGLWVEKYKSLGRAMDEVTL